MNIRGTSQQMMAEYEKQYEEYLRSLEESAKEE